MQLIFHGELQKMYGDSFEMQADSVAEALEGFSRQQADWPRDMRVMIVGDNDRLDTAEKLLIHCDVVHLMPSMSGGGGKFGQIIMGAIVIGVSFIPGIGQAVQLSLLISGGLMVLQGVIGLFLQAPKMKSVNDPEASKYLSVNKNTTEVGTPMTMAWGIIDMAGQWLSIQSDSNNLSFGTFPATTT